MSSNKSSIIRKTSDLIPLCHPLPLDKVQVDVQLANNVVLISCECRVTHKTGVEMEVGPIQEPNCHIFDSELRFLNSIAFVPLVGIDGSIRDSPDNLRYVESA